MVYVVLCLLQKLLQYLTHLCIIASLLLTSQSPSVGVHIGRQNLCISQLPQNLSQLAIMIIASSSCDPRS